MTNPSPRGDEPPRPAHRSHPPAAPVRLLEPSVHSAPAAQVRAELAQPGTRCLVVLVDGARTDWDDDAVLAVFTSTVPVVTALRGVLTRHAAAVALAADLRVAGARAALRVEPLLGGTSLTLPRAVGDAAARLLLLAPRTLDPDEAVRAGLVHEVAATDDPTAHALELAGRVAAAPGVGAAVRRALGRADVADALAQEARLRAVVALHGRDAPTEA